MKDAIKIFITLIAYMGVGPLLGYLIAHSQKGQRIILGMMAFLPCLPPGRLTLMIFSIEKYRGHTKGFEANWLEVLGIALIVANLLNPKPALRRPVIPPGAIIYMLWCTVSLLSILPSFDGTIALMAAFKFTKAVLILTGIYYGLKDEEDLKVILRCVAWALIIQVLIAVKQRYVDGSFQVKGWFEHQNSMGMWAYMASIPLLAVALWPKTPNRDAYLYLAGSGAGLLLVLLTVSRGGLGAILIGFIAVVGKSWLCNRSMRLGIVTIIGGAGAVLMLVQAKDTFGARLEEVKSTAEASPYDLRDILNMQSAAMLEESFVGIGWNNFAIANSRPHGIKFSQILEDWEESRGFTIYEENYVNNALTESLYWLVLAETGWPGYLGMLLFFLTTIWWGLRNWRYHRGTLFGSLSYGILVCFLIAYTHSMVERILTQTKNLSFWLLLCGILSAFEVLRAKNRVSVKATSKKKLMPTGYKTLAPAR